MTENKRFTIRKSMYIADGYVVVDNEHEYTFSTLSRSKVINYCRILNLLNDENNQVRKENEQLKQFKEDVFAKIDMHLRMLPTARDNEFNEENGDPSLYTGAIYMLETLKKELQE